MIDLKDLVSYVQSIGLVGVLTILAIPKTRVFLGFKNGGEYDEKFKQLWDVVVNLRDNHLAHLNDKMSDIAEDVAHIKGKLDI